MFQKELCSQISLDLVAKDDQQIGFSPTVLCKCSCLQAQWFVFFWKTVSVIYKKFEH